MLGDGSNLGEVPSGLSADLFAPDQCVAVGDHCLDRLLLPDENQCVASNFGELLWRTQDDPFYKHPSFDTANGHNLSYATNSSSVQRDASHSHIGIEGAPIRDHAEAG